MKDFLVRVRLCGKHIAAAVTALQFWGDHLHEDARHQDDPKKADAIREEAETAFAARKSLWTQYQGDPVKATSDDSVHGNSAPVQITRFSLPKDARELLVSVVMAASVLTSLVLWSKLHDAEKDIQTQVWLRDDALTKFEQGPYADLKAHVIANEINCHKEK